MESLEKARQVLVSNGLPGVRFASCRIIVQHVELTVVESALASNPAYCTSLPSSSPVRPAALPVLSEQALSAPGASWGLEMSLGLPSPFEIYRESHLVIPLSVIIIGNSLV